MKIQKQLMKIQKRANENTEVRAMPNLIANAVYEDEDILDFDDEDSKYDLDQIEDEMDSIGMMEQQGSSNDSMDGSNDSMNRSK